jgi:hypothetical protein
MKAMLWIMYALFTLFVGWIAVDSAFPFAFRAAATLLFYLMAGFGLIAAAVLMTLTWAGIYPRKKTS